MDNELAPNAGIYIPEVPQEIKQELNAEQNMVLAAGPLINSILDWFDDQIALLNTLEGIDLNKDIEIQVHGRKYASDRLLEAKADLETMRDSYTKRKSG